MCGAADTKGTRPIAVRLNPDAIDILAAGRGWHPIYVYLPPSKEVAPAKNRRPVGKCSCVASYKAVKRAGRAPFRWHDLRHTWASWHIQAGTPLLML
jgi:integrase